MNAHFKLVSAIVLCTFTAFESITIKWVQEHQTSNPSSILLVLLTEVIKFAICAIYVATSHLKTNRPLNPQESRPILQQPQEEQVLSVEPRTMKGIVTRMGLWAYLIPALLYATSNNLVYYALGQMSAPLFTLLVNFKIPLTGLMAKILLSKRMGWMQWASLLIMCLGTVLALLRFEQGTHWGATWQGTLAVLSYAMCSATAAVLMEYITRHVRYSQHIMEQNLQFTIFSISVNLVFMVFRGAYNDLGKLQWIHVASMASMVCNGFATAVVLKYAGSIVKTHAVAMASIMTALLGYLIWPNQNLPFNYFLGAFLCIVALRLYIMEKMARRHHHV
jgi:drug/metabolite transporter (DMT)-like permease